MTKYNAKDVEDKWRKYWEKEKIYKFNPKKKGEVYSIDTPPPYISGKMHMGHAFSYAQQDFIIRFMRMRGFNVFYPFGTDDNGLPTERFIEKANKVKSKSMGRSKFIGLCLKTLKKATPECIKDFIDLGISADYSVYYSTIDKHSQKIAQESFLDLYKKGDAYKKDFPTLWCPDCQTSIAQAELEDKEKQTFFSTIKFGVEGKDLLIATTRPELLGACVAVFVNPKDKKNKKYIGKKAIVPLFGHEVPIIADESADLKKGTGALMVCSYGDKYDVEAINKHKLEPRIIFDKDGRIVSENYKGLKAEEARKKILKDLDEKNLIVEKKQINHAVNVHDKCGTAIEFLPTEQWFVKILDYKKDLLSQANKISWYPNYMKKRYENWVKGLDWDWSISRNRYFGVPIPVWHCDGCGKIILPNKKDLPVDPMTKNKKCSCGGNAKAEEKVFDTWMTSSLTPQIAADLVKGIKIPYSLRPQGHDIIRTWAFYTIVKSYLHDKKIPWKDIVISGNVSLGGEKMSKSKGNVVKPQDVMEKFGSDALRFWAAGSKLGGDLDYQEKDLITGNKFLNKLVNATKFVFMNLEDWDYKKPKKLEVIDELFLSKLDEMVNSVSLAFENYEYSKAKLEAENFFYKVFADNYLEIVKKRVYQGEGDKKKSAQYSLYSGLLSIVKVLAPIMPFVTEEVYQNYFRKNEGKKSIHLEEWPKVTISKINDSNWNKKLGYWGHFVKVLAAVRQKKSQAKKPMNSEIILTLSETDHAMLLGMIDDLQNVTNAREIKSGKFKVEFV